MDKVPFDPYDFFGYLASGLVLIVGMDLVFGFPNVLGHDFKVVESTFLLLGIYIGGQLVAGPAKALLEDIVVGKILWRPNMNLFAEKKPWLRAHIFPAFYLALPDQTRKKILAKAAAEGMQGTGEDLFLHVRYSPVVLKDNRLMERLGSFLNKYGFNRNLSFSSFIVGTSLLLKMKFSN